MKSEIVKTERFARCTLEIYLGGGRGVKVDFFSENRGEKKRKKKREEKSDGKGKLL